MCTHVYTSYWFLFSGEAGLTQRLLQDRFAYTGLADAEHGFAGFVK